MNAQPHALLYIGGETARLGWPLALLLSGAPERQRQRKLMKTKRLIDKDWKKKQLHKCVQPSPICDRHGMKEMEHKLAYQSKSVHHISVSYFTRERKERDQLVLVTLSSFCPSRRCWNNSDSICDSGAGLKGFGDKPALCRALNEAYSSGLRSAGVQNQTLPLDLNAVYCDPFTTLGHRADQKAAFTPRHLIQTHRVTARTTSLRFTTV